MDKAFDYSIIGQLKLVIQYHHREISLEEGMTLKNEILRNSDFRSDFSFLIDIRNTSEFVCPDCITEYGDWLGKNVKLTGLKRLAIVTDKPSQVANSTIFMLNSNLSEFNYRIFSTIAGAIQWLTIPQLELGYIEGEISKLKDIKCFQVENTKTDH